jgi:hypothetical protein
MSLSQIAATSQGSMVGDYISTSVIAGKAFSVFAVGKAPTGSQAFDEALYTAGGLAVTGGTTTATTHGASPVTRTSAVKHPLPMRR